MNGIYEFGPFRLEVRERRLSAGKRPIHLRPKVFETLCALVERRGSLVEKDELMRLVWPDAIVEENNLALNVTMLRKALREAGSEERWIETVTGKGYRFVAGEMVNRGRVRGEVRGEDGAGGPELLEREKEMGVLRAAWESARGGRREFVCVTGEAGIGKTALLEAYLEEVREERESVLVGQGACVERSGEGEAYLPILEALGRMCRGEDGSWVRGVVERYAPTWLAQMPWLVGAAEAAGLRERVLGATRGRMLREVAEALEVLAEERAVVLVLEDLHWADPSTIELIGALGRRQTWARLLLIGTNRARDAGEAGRTLEALTEELQLRGQCRILRPAPLSEEAIGRLARARLPEAGRDPRVALAIRERTSGNPLFTQALIEYWAAQGGTGDAGRTLPRGVPGSLAAMIQRKIEAIGREEWELLEGASVLGLTFAVPVLAGMLGRDEEEVEARCEGLAALGTVMRRAGTAEWPDGRVSSSFAFGHSLYQEVLYEQIPHSRRARLHRRAGEELEQGLGAAARQRSAELAHHYYEGRDGMKAAGYLEAAAELALLRSAPREAAAHVRRGLSLVKAMPEGEEKEAHEFRLLSMLAPAVIATEGFAAAEAEESYQRAFELGRRMGEISRAYPVLLGRVFLHELRGEFHRSEELLGGELRAVEAEENPMLTVHADSLLACSLFHQGKFTGALERAQRGQRMYDAARDRELLAPYGENPSIACQSWSALCLWFLGYPDRAAEQALALVKFCETPGHGYAHSTAAMYATHVYQLRREALEAGRWAETTLELAERQGYLYNVAFAKVVKGWACAQEGGAEQGLELMREGLSAASAIGAKLDRPYFLAMAAEAQLECGKVAAALASVDEALGLIESGRTFFYEAELYRLRAAARKAAGEETGGLVEQDLERALEVARRQGAKLLELRAACDVLELPRKGGEASEELMRLHAWFEEGHATPDLQRARRLIADRL